MLDDTSAGVEASGTLLSQAIQLRLTFTTDDQGRYTARHLPFGVYRLNVERPGFGADDIQSMNLRTAGYPAEYGRKLGGVIEVTTAENTSAGWHGSAMFDGGSFSTASGAVSAQHARGSTVAGVSADSAHSDRYLDPPVVDNFTNKATSGGASRALQPTCSRLMRRSASIPFTMGMILSISRNDPGQP